MIQYRSKQTLVLAYEKRKTKFHFTKDQKNTDGSESERVLIDRVLRETSNLSASAFSPFPSGFPTDLPLPFVLGILASREITKTEKASRGNKDTKNTKERSENAVDFSPTEYPRNVIWIAPIRSKPLRFYDGTKRTFSPEGGHAPYLLQQSLSIRAKSEKFIEKLSNFGRSSGLFDKVEAHKFGNSAHSPFEILIKISDLSLNINNVGYGISQVLPLLVDFLAVSEPSIFAIQQPEVHLHPKAQAALGDLIYELTQEKDHSFVLETHSDYLIDRYRLALSKDRKRSEASILYFNRVANNNLITPIKILDDGSYSEDQPSDFRNFFVNESIALLDI